MSFFLQYDGYLAFGSLAALFLYVAGSVYSHAEGPKLQNGTKTLLKFLWANFIIVASTLVYFLSAFAGLVLPLLGLCMLYDGDRTSGAYDRLCPRVKVIGVRTKHHYLDFC